MNRQLFRSVSTLLFLTLTASVAIAQDDPETSVEGKAATAAPETSSDTLTIGSPAAPLNIEHWISDAGGKFAPVTELESGKVYVVEFWATWCGPCIGCMPHLAEIQTKYSDQNVQVISLSDESLEKVEKFLERDYKPKKTTKVERASEKHAKRTERL